MADIQMMLKAAQEAIKASEEFMLAREAARDTQQDAILKQQNDQAAIFAKKVDMVMARLNEMSATRVTTPATADHDEMPTSCEVIETITVETDNASETNNILVQANEASEFNDLIQANEASEFNDLVQAENMNEQASSRTSDAVQEIIMEYATESSSIIQENRIHQDEKSTDKSATLICEPQSLDDKSDSNIEIAEDINNDVIITPHEEAQLPNNNVIFAKIMNGETFNSEDIVDEPSFNCIMCSQATNETTYDVIPTVVTTISAPEVHLNTSVIVEEFVSEKMITTAPDVDPATELGSTTASVTDDELKDAHAPEFENESSSNMVLEAASKEIWSPEVHLFDAPEIMKSLHAKVPYAPDAPVLGVHMECQQLIATFEIDATTVSKVNAAPALVYEVDAAPVSAYAPENEVSFTPVNDKEGCMRIDKMLADTNIENIIENYTYVFKFKNSVEYLIILKIYSVHHAHMTTWEHQRDKWIDLMQIKWNFKKNHSDTLLKGTMNFWIKYKYIKNYIPILHNECLQKMENISLLIFILVYDKLSKLNNNGIVKDIKSNNSFIVCINNVDKHISADNMRLIQSVKTAESKDNINKDNNCDISKNIMSDALISDGENDDVISLISEEESEYEFTNPSQFTNYNYHARKKYRSELDRLNVGIPLNISKTRSGKIIQ